MKKCTKCKKEKDIKEFHKQAMGKFGVRSVCIDCLVIDRKIYESVNRERINKKMREWRKNDLEQYNKYQRKNRANRADKINANRRLRYKEDDLFRLKKAEVEKKYKESGRRSLMNRKNPKHKERAIAWRINNPQKVKEQIKKYRADVVGEKGPELKDPGFFHD